MLCKSGRLSKSKSGAYFSLFIGVILTAFGILGALLEFTDSSNIVMLLGMFTGIGAVFTGISIITLCRMRFAPEKLRKEEINLKDERNIQVTRASYAVSNAAASIMLGAMAFVLVYMDYIVPALIAVGVLCVQMLVFLISYRVFNKKM